MITAPAKMPPASFDLRPFGRMFWKEYRQQRTLCCGVLIFGMALQLFLRIVAGVISVTSSEYGDVMVALWTVPLFLAGFFLVGSTAMLFALEREERTSDWLQNLAAPPAPILLAKYGFAVAATTCLMLAMGLWTAVLSIGMRIQMEWLFVKVPSFGWVIVGVLCMILAVGAGILLWGTLGSLTSRRVVTAVPAAMVWWMLLFLVPLISVSYFCWRFGIDIGRDVWFGRIVNGVIVFSFLGIAVLNLLIGLRWCRGKYLDASWLEGLNDRLTARLMPWRVRSSRVPATIESEHSGWRTWQRLIWQERHRESLHIGLLVIVCATSVLLTLYSLADNASITFAVLPLIAVLPCTIGVLGFRFDSAGQQLRFLANRGTSPTMIWLAKHAVWLPRAFWIPAVCWGVACLTEWAFIPWSGVDWMGPHSGIDGIRHPLVINSFLLREHFVEVTWFALMSYAVGQTAAMLFRRMILSVGAGLMATIVLWYWQFAVSYWHLPHWWTLGGTAVWLMLLTYWYSHHWLIERRSLPVVRRLAIGLILPPLFLLIGTALFRWLEFPGFGPSSSTLMALLYPREAERRDAILGQGAPGQAHQLNEIRAAINQIRQPTSPESRSIQERLASVNHSYQLLSQIRSSPEFVTSVPSEASHEEQEQAIRERFWSVNEKTLATIMEVLSDELPATYRTHRSDTIYDAPPNPQLLLDAGRLCMWRGGPEPMWRYYVAGLRLARCRASQGDLGYWAIGRETQTEILQSLVEWSSYESVTREMLIAAIDQTRDELSRFPTLREASVAEFIWGIGSEKWIRQELENEADPASLRIAKNVAATLFSHEFARRERMNEQALFWRWHLYHTLEWSMRTPGVKLQRLDDLWKKQFARVSESDNAFHYTIFQPAIVSRFGSRFGQDFVGVVASYEAVNREAMLALALALWKKDHDGDLPDSLENLSRHCVIEGLKEPERVLPVMALNNPWTGVMFSYSAQSRKLTESENDTPVVILALDESSALGQENRAVKWVSEKGNGFEFASPSTIVGELRGVMLQSHFGLLSLEIPEKRQR